MVGRNLFVQTRRKGWLLTASLFSKQLGDPILLGYSKNEGVVIELVYV